MCQLTYVNLKSKKENILMVYCLTLFGSTRHKDGTGFMNDGKIFKTHLTAEDLHDWGSILNEEIKTNNPIAAHVRLSSLNVPVCEENSHPHDFEDFILEHNGTLSYKDFEKQKALSKIVKEINEHNVEITRTIKESDSIVFGKELQIKLKEKQDLVWALTETMKLFYGKFAFIIYYKKDNKYYIVRGKTADLHYTLVLDEDKKPTGKFIVQTEKITLSNGLFLFNNMMGLNGKKELIFSEIKELEKETIYRMIPMGFEKIGELKENEEEKTNVEKAVSTWVRGTVNNVVSKYKNEKEASKKISKFMVHNGFSPKDIEQFFLFFFGIPLIEANLEYMNKFIKYVIPMLSAPKNLRKKIISKNLVVTWYFYHKYNISAYPWTLCPNDEKFKLINEIVKEKEALTKG